MIYVYKFHFHFKTTDEIIEQDVKFDFTEVHGDARVKMINRRFGYWKRSIIHYENKWRKKTGYLPVDWHEYTAWYEMISEVES